MEEPVTLVTGDQEDGEAALARQTGTVARFNRFYAKQIGSLNDSLTQGTFSPTEARVLAELALRGSSTATELATALALDAGYLSRIVRGFEERGLIVKAISEADARRVPISLTQAGGEASTKLERLAHEDIRALLARLPADRRERLVEAMDGISRILGESHDEKAPSFVLRGPEPGDMGWVVQRHGVLYQQEFGWDEQFEALVAEVVAKFVKHYDPKREQCWIAEREGVPVGCAFLVKHNDENAKLRLLLVEPSARGLGIGTRLVDECLRYARRARYRRVTIWTDDVLRAARRIYQRAGFRLVAEERHLSFGHDLTGQNWELIL